MHDHLHQIVAHLFGLAWLAIAVIERVRRELETQQRAHARTEDLPVVRFRQKVIPAGLDRLHAIGRVVERGDEDDGNARRARIALDATAHFEARRAIVDTQITRGHRDIENAEVRLLLETGF